MSSTVETKEGKSFHLSRSFARRTKSLTSLLSSPLGRDEVSKPCYLPSSEQLLKIQITLNFVTSLHAFSFKRYANIVARQFTTR
jgi:hypothetical protein